MLRFARALQNLDRRLVYLVLLAAMSAPFIWHYTLPIYPDTTTKQFYNTIEELAEPPRDEGGIVLVLHNWGPGTAGENKPQFQVIMRHLIRSNLDFVFVCTVADPIFHDTAMLAFEEAIADEARLASDRGETPRELVYGEDYLDFGYINAPTFATFAEAVVTKPRELFGRDYKRGRSLTTDSFPLLERYRSIEDLAAVLVISAGDEAKDISGIVKSKHPDLNVGAATMGIVANDLYPYVKSGQLFGMINSARGASEYRKLMDDQSTMPVENAMSAGKTTLLVLLIVGNVAFLLVRWGQRSGRLAPPTVVREPLPPLPGWFMWGLFLVVIGTILAAAGYEFVRFQQTGAIMHAQAAGDDDAFGYTYFAPTTLGEVQERVAQDNGAQTGHNRLLEQYERQSARKQFWEYVEARVGDLIAVICILGVFAFTLGDNRFYRVIEAIIVGGTMAYLLDQLRQIVYQDWFLEIMQAWTSVSTQLQPGQAGYTSAWNLLWILLVIPGSLWYFTYSKKYRWLNQWIVALFLGFALGPEFENRVGQVLPQIVDSVQPLWPWTPYAGGVVDPAARVEHLVFLIVLVLSLTYFIFFFRPKTSVGNGVLTTGRLIMMVGFGAMFGNTVNTRLSWLVLPILRLWESTIGKIVGQLPVW